MSLPSDSSESSSSSTESSQMNISESNENSSSRLSEMQSSTELPTSERRPISRPVVPGNLPQNWKPGQSGNPAGRPKGVKNQITILKEALELKLRNKAAYKIEKVLDKAVELALLGDRIMIKLLLELHMSKAAHQEDTAARASQVAVVIQNLTDKGSATVSDVIDVTSQIKVSKDE